METCSFLDYFEDMPDHRIDRKKLYPCNELLLLTLCAVISGAEGWSDVEDYGEIKLEFLRNYLPYNNGVPSDDTLRRFFRSLDAKYFQEKFCAWASSIMSSSEIKLISIDGKTSRHSFDGSNSALHMVSAFASEARIVMCQEKVSDKSNEITAIPNLLEWLDLKGAIVTIDAMGCQFEIANKIINKGGEYIFSLKGNQGSLNEDVRLFFEDKELISGSNIDEFETVDGGHGRIETRKCLVCNDISWLTKRHKNWSSIKSIIKIESTREIKGLSSSESRYYISSIQKEASQVLHAIRSHWAIENSLHWVLDMSFADDKSRIRKGNAPQNMSVIKHVALNMIRNVKKERQSIKRMRKISGWSDIAMNDIICQIKF